MTLWTSLTTTARFDRYNYINNISAFGEIAESGCFYADMCFGGGQYLLMMKKYIGEVVFLPVKGLFEKIKGTIRIFEVRKPPF